MYNKEKGKLKQQLYFLKSNKPILKIISLLEQGKPVPTSEDKLKYQYSIFIKEKANDLNNLKEQYNNKINAYNRAINKINEKNQDITEKLDLLIKDKINFVQEKESFIEELENSYRMSLPIAQGINQSNCSFYVVNDVNYSFRYSPIIPNLFAVRDKSAKKQNVQELKDKYNKLYNNVIESQKNFIKISLKNDLLINENKNLKEIKKQKNIILSQIETNIVAIKVKLSKNKKIQSTISIGSQSTSHSSKGESKVFGLFKKVFK